MFNLKLNTMKLSYLTLLGAVALFTFSCCKTENNPLLSEWDAQYQIPPFEKIKAEHYMPAYLKAMEIENKEIESIINNPEEPTFENTIVAYDNTGELLSRISSVFGSANGVNSNDTLRNIAKDLSPILSAHYSEISLNEKLFERVKAVYDKRDSLNLEPDQMRLLTEMYKGFVRSGAELSPEKKEELKKINSEISALQLDFGQNLLQETAAYTLVIDNKEDLSGLTEGQIAEAAARAEKAGQSGKWIFGLDNPSIMPFLANADNRDLRRKMLEAYLNRCNNNNANDNKEVIKKLVSLRLQKAKLMGFNNCAEQILDNRMAKTPSAVYNLLDQIWGPALEVAKNEANDMRAIIKEEGAGIELEAWDWRYYFQKAMQKKFSLDESLLSPYFKLENVREGIFYVANQLYGLSFKQLENVPVPSSEAVAFEVSDKDNSVIGVVFFDMFARPGQKRGGAWCGGFRSEYYKDGKRIIPLVTIVGNFTRPVGDKPALLTMDEVGTYFHEFGHGLASLLKNVKYKGNGGYPRDFVELPSQINEHWAFQPEVLKVYAKHYQTGEVIPQELVDKVEKAGKYGQGFATVEYLAASYLDMDYHVLDSIPENFDVLAFESKVLGDRGLISQIPPRYRSTYFNHTFGGGYTAGYYSYIWAEVLDADAFEAYLEKGNIFDQEVAGKFRKEILERAGDDEAMTLYLNFRGKSPDIKPLLKNRGLAK
jgi:Zn-dependent oligopeptidases